MRIRLTASSTNVPMRRPGTFFINGPGNAITAAIKRAEGSTASQPRRTSTAKRDEMTEAPLTTVCWPIQLRIVLASWALNRR